MSRKLKTYRLLKDYGYSDAEIEAANQDLEILLKETEITKIHFRLSDLTGFENYYTEDGVEKWQPQSEGFWRSQFEKELQRFQNENKGIKVNPQTYKSVLAKELTEIYDKFISHRGSSDNTLLSIAVNGFLEFLTKSKNEVPKTREGVIKFLAENGFDESIFEIMRDGMIYTKAEGSGNTFKINDNEMKFWEEMAEVYYSEDVETENPLIKSSLYNFLIDYYLQEYFDSKNKLIEFSFLYYKLIDENIILRISHTAFINDVNGRNKDLNWKPRQLKAESKMADKKDPDYDKRSEFFENAKSKFENLR